MKTSVHVYPSLGLAIIAMLRIYQPLTKGEIVSRLKVWKREGMLGFPYVVEEVPIVLDLLQEELRIEYAVGTWRTR